MKRLPVAVAGLSLLVCPAVFGQTVKVNSNAKTQLSKYKTYSSKSLDKPGEPARNPDGGHGRREEEGVVWRGQGTAEHMSKSDQKDADEVKKIVVKMFQQFAPK